MTDISKDAELQQSCITAVSDSTFKQKPIFTDYFFNNFKWYRKCRKLTWYQHKFTHNAYSLSSTFVGTFWALYGKINSYSDVVDTEVW